MTQEPARIDGSAHYDQGVESAVADLVALFENIPKGSSYTIASDAPLDGEYLIGNGADTRDVDFIYGWTNRYIPAGWSANFAYTIALGSGGSGGNAPSVTIRAEIIREPG